MKQLQVLSPTRLSVLEFGQHNKSILTNIDLLGKDFITDGILNGYLQNLQSKSNVYDKAMIQIAKSDETAKIVAADKRRDNAVTSLTRLLSAHELTEEAAEYESYQSLYTVFNAYKGIQKWNLEEETNGIDNLLADLGSEKHRPHVERLEMQKHVDRLATQHSHFKTLFAGRTQEALSKEHYNVPQLRKEMKALYGDMIGYVLSMAKAKDSDPQYSKCLDAINTVRKYYHDLLAKRKPGSNDTPEAPIPPMA